MIKWVDRHKTIRLNGRETCYNDLIYSQNLSKPNLEKNGIQYKMNFKSSLNVGNLC